MALHELNCGVTVPDDAESSATIPRVPENAPGDFYVQADICIQCCLPHHEAPELLNDPQQPFRECYFRRQPANEAEVEQAVNAMCVSCVDALRYGGSDAMIIHRLRQRNAADLCDQTPEGEARLAAVASAERFRAKLVQSPRELWLVLLVLLGMGVLVAALAITAIVILPR